MKTKKTIIKFLKITFLIAGFGFLIFGFFQLFKGDFFRIDQVVCFDSLDKVQPCQTDLWMKINSMVLGKNLIFLSPQKLSQEIQNELIVVKEVKLEKKLPRRLIIYLGKRKPIAVVEAKGEYWEVDYQGVVLAKPSQPTDLPLVVSEELSLSADNRRIESSPVLASLDCLYRLLFKSIEVRRLEITSSQKLTLYLKTGPEVLISLERDLQPQVDSLQLIYERAKIEGRQIKKIDLRFDKPVITNG